MRTPMEDKTKLELGLQTRREVLGAEHVDRSLGQASDFARPMQELVTEYCWGAVWSRPGLDRKVRSLLNIVMLTALGRRHELEVHVRGAVTNGVSASGDPGGAAADGDLLRRPGGDGSNAHGRGGADRPRRRRAALGRTVPGVIGGGSPRRVGFVGLGAMGGPMARRLVQAGHHVSVYDTAPEAATALAEAGAEVCESARGVAEAAELVLVSLPSPEVVSEVARELAGGSALRVYVDLSTTGPQVAEEVAALLETAGVGVVDAPVSGGTSGRGERTA